MSAVAPRGEGQSGGKGCRPLNGPIWIHELLPQQRKGRGYAHRNKTQTYCIFWIPKYNYELIMTLMMVMPCIINFIWVLYCISVTE